jgi:2-phosphosulfolactate phosphatase
MRGESVAVVIDTLRFTSTACVALAAGAKGITVVSDIAQARNMAAGLATEWSAELPAASSPLLCGERDCVRIPGFDLGNSPAEYDAATVKDRELIFSTTNGTLAVEACQAAAAVVLGSLVNRDAICRWLAGLLAPAVAHNAGVDVWCVCAGTDGQVALEDVLTAGAIIERLMAIAPQTSLGNDASSLALAAWKSVAGAIGGDDAHAARQSLAGRLVATMHTALGGRNLVEAGFGRDLQLVAEVDSLQIVPHQDSACRFVA